MSNLKYPRDLLELFHKKGDLLELANLTEIWSTLALMSQKRMENYTTLKQIGDEYCKCVLYINPYH